ncbi:methyl-accepting chemotaxis protein [Altericroceibacterium xinjiangense]|uniref:methyl-accepting chemotaxis protein n=1 Tax=Altericroceibacterium xinjiangense TaxID=762261 RepID=UPI000F7EAE95|nr:methyl-accepting chemotaxis protein [Altericroceibacterium xinjiangense]
MNWFQKYAPIRLKLRIAVGVATAFTALAALGAFIGGWIGGAIGLAATLGVLALGLWAREAIAHPYVSTVVRMEGLAAGDLTSPIEFMDYTDCVGRMTTAMLTFRDTAVAQKTSVEEQTLVVAALAEQLRKLAQGDLTGMVTVDFPPAYAELKTHLNDATRHLREMVGAVNDSAEAIGTGTREIAEAADDLARRTGTSAASLEETSASLVQIDESLKVAASDSEMTVERASGANAAVESGRAIAEQAVQAMGRVSDSAKGIDAVIEGLDKIAFQTRVLAMNAAVEAGRAGDAGRGFAVVADLVSALARRAEEEAKSARDQLTVTQADIGTAVEAVHKVDGALSDIRGGVHEVHQLLGKLAADNKTQSDSVSQISTAIGSMDEATQQNAAMVEQASAAVGNLLNEVSALSQRAALFNIGDSRPALHKAAPKVAPLALVTRAAKAAPRIAKPLPYLSPVKPLPAANSIGADGEADQWKDF